MKGTAAMMAIGLLAACGGQGAGISALQPAASSAQGFTFALTGAVRGGVLDVTRPAAPLGYSDGLTAKRATMAYRAGQGARANPVAFGQFVGGTWRFEQGCA